MGLTTALYTSLSGLSASSQLISVAGNNIANVNTTAFKGSRVTFDTQISENMSSGSAPTANSGGTNPTQIGLGVQPGSITRDFSAGSVQLTGVNTDMAIDGNGFFILKDGGNTTYSRAGSFSLDRDFNLVAANGSLVQGYGVDTNFNVIPGSLQNLSIPVGALTLAKATQNVVFKGNLNSGGTVATQGSINVSNTLYSDNTATTPALATDALTTVFNAGGTQLFNTGDVVTISDVSRGDGSKSTTHTFEVGAANTTGSDDFGTTVQDLMDFMRDSLGIDTSVGGTTGVSIAGGQISIEGNSGHFNDLSFTNSSISSTNAGASNPLTFNQTQAADGESVRTSFVAYDSLGKPMQLELTAVLEQKPNAGGTIWRYYAQSQDDSDLSPVVGSGLLNFDQNGQLINGTPYNITVDRLGTGAQSPQSITLQFSDGNARLSAFNDQSSSLVQQSDDGIPIGTLQTFSVDGDGTIVGLFSNSLKRDLGQVALATFTNPDGLIEIGSNNFRASPNSGTAAVGPAGSGGAGKITGGALELSNVELSEEFVNLITGSTGFSATSRVLTTADRLIQDLLQVIR